MDARENLQPKNSDASIKRYEQPKVARRLLHSIVDRCLTVLARLLLRKL